MAASEMYGKLIIAGKDGCPDLEFPLDKRTCLIGRDHSCDIRIVNKEISRRHAEVYVEDSGAVFICSMGREPVAVNGAPVTSPLELSTGDKIEVILENRTRVFYFQGDDETVQIRAPARQPLAAVNASPARLAGGKPAAAKGRAGGGPAHAPPPPPPPMPAPGLLRAAKLAGAPAPAPAPPQPPPKLAGVQPAAPAGGMPAALHDAIRAGVQLKRVSAGKPGAPEPPAAGFVPNPADLMKLRAGLRKTAHAVEAAAPAEDEQEAGAEAPAAALEQGAGGQADQPAAQPVDPKPEAAEERPAVQPVGEPASLEAAAAVQPAPEEAGAVLEAAGQEAGEEAAASVPGSAARKRKSVRFHLEAAAERARAAGTPEGAARDATITIRLRKADLEQIINVDDSTVALAEWGLGSMGEGEELPDTVVSKRSRHSVAAPPSDGRTPVRGVLHQLLAGSPALSAGAATPGAMGVIAPAPTPATGAPPTARSQRAAGAELALDPAALAARLAEMAAAHDVAVEVPAEFFTSPALGGPAGRDSLRLVLTPKPHGCTPAASTAGPVQAPGARSEPRTAGRSRLSQAGAPAGAGEEGQGGWLEKTEELQPALAQALLASAGKQQTPAARRRSLSRTPGTKVVIIERGTPASTRAAGAAESRGEQAGSQPTPALLSTIGIQMEAQDCGDDVEQEQLGVGGSADGASPEHDAPAGNTVPLLQYQRVVMRAKACHAEARQLTAQLRRMTAKALKLKKASTALSGALDGERAKRRELQQALQQVVANRAAAELEQQAAVEAQAQAQAAADGEEEYEQGEEAAASPAPWVPRVVVLGRLSQHVSTAQRAGQVVVVRPAQLAGPASALPAPAPVVVLPASARKTAAPSATKPGRTPAPTAAKGATPLPASAVNRRTPATGWAGAAPAPGKTPAASIAKSCGVPELPQSMLKVAAGGEPGASTVVLESVELPGWLFDGEQQAPEVAAAAAAAAEEFVPAAAAPPAEDGVLTAAAPAAGEAVKETPAAEAVESEVEEQEAAEAGMEVDDAHWAAAAAEQQVQPALEAGSDAEEEEEEDFCHLCGQSDEGDILLLCDSCDNACHLSCCQPPLKRVPKGDWFCLECSARQTAAVAAAAAAAKARPAAKRGAKRQAEEVAEEQQLPVEPAAPPSGRGRRGAASAVSKQAAEEQAPKAVRGGKRAAEAEPAGAAESEGAAPSGRGKRGRAAAEPKASREPSASGRTLRGRAAASAAAEEVSTRRSRVAAAPKAEAGARGTRRR